MTTHRVYFSPGMFGFGQLASYDYFAHLERAIGERLRAAGDEVETWVVEVAPTSSLRRRAVKLAELVARTCEAEGPVHLVGHSTGGLDARLVASPDVYLECDPAALAWLPRLASVTCINTPHFGTPLASFFATVSGQRMLHALSALTFIALSFGSPPLAAASALVVAVGRIDRALGLDLRLLDRATDTLLRALDDARSREVRVYLEAIKEDQGAMVQLMPEAMELFQAGVGDRRGVHYQSTASMAPAPIGRILRDPAMLMRPWRAISATIFAALSGITSRIDARYPCAAREAGAETEAFLLRAFGRAPDARANDGVVPFRSQLWGKLVWAGMGDHLDVLGHFEDPSDTPPSKSEEPRHADWLSSGSGFDRERFASLTSAIADGMLGAASS
jgi:triacylglycerol lipase